MEVGLEVVGAAFVGACVRTLFGALVGALV
jgi:hypothetical protein